MEGRVDLFRCLPLRLVVVQMQFRKCKYATVIESEYSFSGLLAIKSKRFTSKISLPILLAYFYLHRLEWQN
jgi:hypothetical protein